MLLCACIFTAISSIAQDSSDSTVFIDHLSDKTLDKLTKQYARLGDRLDKRSASLLRSLEAKEAKLRDQLAATDSNKAASLFAGSATQYQDLQNKLQAKGKSVVSTVKNYIPGLDSMQSALGFIERSGVNLPVDKLEKIQQLSQQLRKLQTSFANAGDLEAFARQREALLSSQLPQLASGGPLLGINKEVYYYQQQLSQYKDVLNNPGKLKDAVLLIVSKVPAFQQYWQRYSLLAQLFPLPANYGTPAALNGLQTTAQVTALVQQRMGINLPGANTGTLPGGGGAPGNAIPDQYVQQAQNQLQELKDKITQAGGSKSDMTAPNFIPDGQHGKPFLQHLTCGFNIQTASGSAYLPSIVDFALTVGYKFSDKVRAGVGASYKLGMGRLNCIQFTHEGVGIRSYLDIKAKGSLWITGGWEYNYLQSFKDLQELHKNVNLWQKSALLGLTKKYTIGKKECNIQLLYDFLAAQQRPVAQALKFRTGVNF